MDKFIRTDENLEVTRTLFEAISNTTDDFPFIVDLSQGLIWFFGGIDHNFDLRRTDSPTCTYRQVLNVIHPMDRELISNEIRRLVHGQDTVLNTCCRWYSRDGRIVWISARGQVIKNADGQAHLLIGCVSEEAMRHLYNPLTGLWNKVKLREDLPGLLAESKGHLMLLDINNLTAINLNHGRAYGDALLREIADLLSSMDAVLQCYHIDHSNFAVAADTKADQDAQELFAYICRQLNEKCTFTGSAVPIDRTIFPDASRLIDAVRMTLKRAKQHGNDRLEFFSAEEMSQQLSALSLFEELAESVQNDFEGFELHYQPQLKGGTYEFYGVEALLRFTSKTRGRVFPDQFIPLLEQSHLIDHVGMWVLETALCQVARWRKQLPDLHVSVNFSSVQFEDSAIGDKIVCALKKAGLPGNVLTVELTESIHLHENLDFYNTLKYLKAYGVSLSIDDFGTGYSNLGYLKQIDVDEIKIDRSFVSGVEKDTYNYNLISNVLEFAKTNSIRVCCEGVEATRELAILEALQPELLQGFLFDKPCTTTEIEEKYLRTDSELYQQRVALVNAIYEYKEKAGVIHFDPKDILRINDVGLWVIRLDEDRNHYELHADDTMERVLGLDQKLTPAQCYEFWHSRIPPEAQDYVHTNVALMITERKPVQLEYPWNHPTLGTVFVRCSGVRSEDCDGLTILEGYHRMINHVKGAQS